MIWTSQQPKTKHESYLLEMSFDTNIKTNEIDIKVLCITSNIKRKKKHSKRLSKILKKNVIKPRKIAKEKAWSIYNENLKISEKIGFTFNKFVCQTKTGYSTFYVML